MAAIGLMMAITADAQYLNDSKNVFYQGKYMIGASASTRVLNGISIWMSRPVICLSTTG